MDFLDLGRQGLQILATAAAIGYAVYRSIMNFIDTIGKPTMQRAVERHIGFLDAMQTHVQTHSTVLREVSQLQSDTLQEVKKLRCQVPAANGSYAPPADAAGHD